MANNSWDDMDKQGKAEIGLLASILLGSSAIAAHNASNRRKAEKRAALERQLQDVRRELSDKKRNIFRAAWYTSEIAELEAKEKELIQEINNL